MSNIGQIRRRKTYEGSNGVFTVDTVGLGRRYILRDKDGSEISLNLNTDADKTRSRELIYRKDLRNVA